MAPEQLEGREASVRSDIYALGLVLFELFTGQPAFEGRDAAEFLRLRESHPSRTPTSLVRDLDPAIERTILRCLEPDPRLRPASALDVARSLPGGDPLAEALAAGETPSPELVAAAGPDIVMRPVNAFALLVVIGVALTGVLLLTEHTQMVSMVPMENSPEVLASKARELVRSLGYPVSAAHTASGFRHEVGYLEHGARWISPEQSSLAQWKAVLRTRPSPVSFWYAQSDAPLVPSVAPTAEARPLDSLPAIRDAVSVDLDLDGRLLRFATSPTKQEPPATPTGTVDWQRLFSAAGLDIAAFTQTAGPHLPPVNADAHVVWIGSYPGRSELPVRVEGRAVAGTLTSFDVLFPWTNRDPWPRRRTDSPPAMLLLVIWMAPCIVARFNWRSGRADVRGALHIGTFGFLTDFGSMLLKADARLSTFVNGTAFLSALAFGAWAAVLYIALEPWVRRWWSHAMIGWARVLAGRWRDPIVARDVLVGLALGIGYRCAYLAGVLGTIHNGAPPLTVASIEAVPGDFVLSHLSGPQFTAGNMLASATSGMSSAAVAFFLLALFRSLLRNQWLGVAALCIVSCLWTFNQPEFRRDWLTFAVYLAFLAVFTLVALRYGFFAIVIGSSAGQLIGQSVLTTHFGAWYGRSSLVAVLLVSALALWAVRILLAHRLMSAST
jgi:serine/threonine-protein kinase